MLLLAMLTACTPVLVQPVAKAPAQVEVVSPAGEEQPTTVEVEVEAATGSAYYAANPELIAAHRYDATPGDVVMTDSEFYAANPELMAINCYAAGLTK